LGLVRSRAGGGRAGPRRRPRRSRCGPARVRGRLRRRPDLGKPPSLAPRRDGRLARGRASGRAGCLRAGAGRAQRSGRICGSGRPPGGRPGMRRARPLRCAAAASAAACRRCVRRRRLLHGPRRTAQPRQHTRCKYLLDTPLQAAPQARQQQAAPAHAAPTSGRLPRQSGVRARLRFSRVRPCGLACARLCGCGLRARLQVRLGRAAPLALDACRSQRRFARGLSRRRLAHGLRRRRFARGLRRRRFACGLSRRRFARGLRRHLGRHLGRTWLSGWHRGSPCGGSGRGRGRGARCQVRFGGPAPLPLHGDRASCSDRHHHAAARGRGLPGRRAGRRSGAGRGRLRRKRALLWR